MGLGGVHGCRRGVWRAFRARLRELCAFFDAALPCTTYAASTRAQIVIAALLKANTTVKRLDLARNQIGDAGAVALANLLRDNSCIEYLNLESNMFGEAGTPDP